MCPVGRTLVSPVFIGREAELATLTAALDAAVGGDPAVVLLSGEAGVGKTRLVEEAAERASEAGAGGGAGSCIEMGGGRPAVGPPPPAVRPLPLAHASRSLMRATSPEELDEFIGPARSELGQVLPDLDPDGALGRAPLGEGGTARLLELVVGVIERLAADRPLMFVIEDLHWADRSTLDLVALLVRVLHGARVLVVVSFRSDELHRSHPLRPLVTGWERVRAVQRIELPRLGRAEVAQQLEAILGAPPSARLVDQVHERSEGNAFLVEEILGAVQGGADPDQLPLSLRDVLLARVERLDPSTQRLLRIAAAGGRAVSDRLLAAVAGLEEAELDAALREAVEHHVLVVDDTERGYVFRHALTRDAIYGDTLPRERVKIHTAYGEALSADPALAGGNVAVAAALAPHWRGGPPPPRGAAGGRGGGRGAPAGARGVDRGGAAGLRLRAGRGAGAPRAGPRDLATGSGRRRAQRHRRRRGAAPCGAERVCGRCARSVAGDVRRGARRARARCRSGAPRAAHGGAGGDRARLGTRRRGAPRPRARRRAAARRVRRRPSVGAHHTGLAARDRRRFRRRPLGGGAGSGGGDGGRRHRARGRGAHDARAVARVRRGRQRPGGARGGAAPGRGGRGRCLGAPRPPQPLGRAADPRPVARVGGGRGTGSGAGGARRPHALGLRGPGRDQPRGGAVPPRPLGRRAPGAHPRDGPRAGEPVRERDPRSPRPDRRARRAP